MSGVEVVTSFRALHHPNVVRMLAACWDPPNVCLVLQYYGKGSLDGLLQGEEPLTWKHPKMNFLTGIARGMVRVLAAALTRAAIHPRPASAAGAPGPQVRQRDGERWLGGGRGRLRGVQGNAS